METERDTSLPDATAAAQAPAHGLPSGVTASDLRRGYTRPDVQRTPPYASDITGENTVGDPYTYGGFLGRPQGNAR